MPHVNPACENDRSTRVAAGLQRAADAGVEISPGQDVEFIVVDDAADSRDRVRLSQEDGEHVDVGVYRDLLVRAAESVVSPVGWRRDDVEEFLSGRVDGSLAAYGD